MHHIFPQPPRTHIRYLVFVLWIVFWSNAACTWVAFSCCISVAYTNIPVLFSCVLQAGADVNKCKDDGASPLFVASHKGHTEIVGLLLQVRPPRSTQRVSRAFCSRLNWWLAFREMLSYNRQFV